MRENQAQPTCTCPSGDGSLRWPCPAHPPIMMGPQLRRQASQLLEQLASNRPRRALDLDATRRLLETLAAPSGLERLTDALIRAAWDWGVSCEVDDVRWGEIGDSHNEMLRDRTRDAATRLLAALVTAASIPDQEGGTDA